MMTKPSDVDCAYTAGLIDGEGSICIARKGRGYYQPCIEVCTTDNVLAPYLRETWGGFLLVRYRKKINPKWTDANMWGLTGFDNLIWFLEAIRPHLRLKQIQADLMIQFCQSRKLEMSQRRRRGYSIAELELVTHLQSQHQYT